MVKMQENKEDLNKENYEESLMRRVMRTGTGFSGGVLALLGVILLTNQNTSIKAIGLFLIGIGFYLFYYGSTGR